MTAGLEGDSEVCRISVFSNRLRTLNSLSGTSFCAMNYLSYSSANC